MPTLRLLLVDVGSPGTAKVNPGITVVVVVAPAALVVELPPDKEATAAGTATERAAPDYNAYWRGKEKRIMNERQQM